IKGRPDEKHVSTSHVERQNLTMRMSVIIKSLVLSAPVVDNNPAAPNDPFGVIPAQTASTVYDLYAAPKDSIANRAAILKAIRLANTHTASVKVTLYVNRPNSSGFHRRRLITPVDMVLGPNQIYVDDTELTLEPGDKLQGRAEIANVVQYWISGVERDVS
ncbi:MAG TPA: hypothetical protein VK850_14510, partial [Candidatus Binatia bacterium]|nr:hypothetical protein [Candidatus Binatia bacterium]